MIIPVRCFTCGKVMADKYDYYLREAAKLELEDANVKKGGAVVKVPAKPTKKQKEAIAAAAAEQAKAEQAAAEEAHATRHFDKTRTGALLDSMGLTRYCCRRHMLSTVDMMEII